MATFFRSTPDKVYDSHPFTFTLGGIAQKGAETMTISVIRTATPEDRQRVNAAARRFCKRYGIAITEVDNEVFKGDLDALIDFHITYDTCTDASERSRLRAKWSRAMCRALKVKYDRRIDIIFGHVGIRID